VLVPCERKPVAPGLGRLATSRLNMAVLPSSVENSWSLVSGARHQTLRGFDDHRLFRVCYNGNGALRPRVSVIV
jgi:hypothetical protein